jgi:ribokinase
MKKSILTIGSLTFDIFLRPKRQEIIRHYQADKSQEEYFAFPYGEKVRVEDVHECFGGGAANTAIAFQRLGFSASSLGAIGDDQWGQLVVNNLEANGVDANFVQTHSGKTGFSVILNSFEGERTVIAFKGANRQIESMDPEVLDQFEAVHLCHLSGKAQTLFAQVRSYFEANPEKLLSWNPGKEQLEKGLAHYQSFLPQVDLLFVNLEEAEEFTGSKANGKTAFNDQIADFREIFQKFFAQGFQGVVIITDGQNGSQACDGKVIYHTPIDNTSKRVDALGAGDGFGSAVAASIFSKKSLPQALKNGTINAASVVNHYGAQKGLLTTKELEINQSNSQLKITKISFKN